MGSREMSNQLEEAYKRALKEREDKDSKEKVVTQQIPLQIQSRAVSQECGARGRITGPFVPNATLITRTAQKFDRRRPQHDGIAGQIASEYSDEADIIL